MTRQKSDLMADAAAMGRAMADSFAKGWKAAQGATEPIEDMASRRRDARGLVHAGVLVGQGFGQYQALWCSGEPAHDLEYEEESEMLTCLACLARRKFDP